MISDAEQYYPLVFLLLFEGFPQGEGVAVGWRRAMLPSRKAMFAEERCGHALEANLARVMCCVGVAVRLCQGWFVAATCW